MVYVKGEKFVVIAINDNGEFVQCVADNKKIADDEKERFEKEYGCECKVVSAPFLVGAK